MAAQDVGDRVRVTVADGISTGRVSAVTGDGLDLTLSDGRSRYFVRDEIIQLERRRTKSAWRVGLLIGGGSVTLLAFNGLYGEEYCAGQGSLIHGCDRDEIKTRGFAEATGMALGIGAVGGALGAGVGALIRSETWEGIAIDGTEATVTPIIDLHLNRDRTTAVMLGLRVRW